MNEEVTNNISTSDVPKLIEEQFELMTSLKENLDVAKSRAYEADIKAKEANSKKIGLFNKKDAMEAIQSTQISLSEATLKNTEALEKTFEYQQALTNITKFLFGLGVSNIAVNRTIVHELELRLEHASEEKIDELARGELLNVIRDLKAQEDLAKKQTDFSLKLKEVNSSLDRVSQELKNYTKAYQMDLEKMNKKLKSVEAKNNILILIFISSFFLLLVGIILAFIF